MGNSQQCPQNIEQSLLTKQQFMKLEIGSIIDHRDTEGRFRCARVKHISKHTIKLQYIGFAKNVINVNYNNNPSDFAVAKSVSHRPALGPLSDLKKNNVVQFRPIASNNCEWRTGMIWEMDETKDGDIRSGQVNIKYKDHGQLKSRWTHLDNQYEIRSNQKPQQQPNRDGKKSRNNHYNNHSNNYINHNGNNSYNQHQTQKYAQVQRQDQMTIRTQKLLDNTEDQIKATKEYLNAVMDNSKTKEQIRRYNQKVVAGLQCFQMKVDGMRYNAKKENISFDEAFQASGAIIGEFEIEYKSKFGNNKYIMQRLNPCLNYMKAVLQDKEVPDLPYINSYKFDKNIASEVITAISYAQNHTIPDRENHINDNKEHYKDQQKQLIQQYKQGKYNQNINKNLNHNQFIQDYNTDNIAFGNENQYQDMHQKDTQNRYQKPNLWSGTGDAMSEDEQ